MPAVIVYPAAARPYPGEVPMPVHEAGVSVPDPGLRPDPADVFRTAEDAEDAAEAGAAMGEPGNSIPLEELDAAERSCSETTKAGTPCKGRPGDDGLCAAHKTKGA